MASREFDGYGSTFSGGQCSPENILRTKSDAELSALRAQAYNDGDWETYSRIGKILEDPHRSQLQRR